MKMWMDAPLLGFDTETTGVDPTRARIVTASLVQARVEVGEGRVSIGRDQFWLLDPGVEIPPGAQEVHGISTEYARVNGVSAQIAIEQICASIAAAAREGIPLVIFNANYDLPLLEAEAARHGVPGVYDRLGQVPLYVVDPLVLDRQFDRYRKGKRTLQAMAEHYGVQVEGQLHDARNDVLTSLLVLAALGREKPAIYNQQLPLLYEEQKVFHAEWARSFNSWLASKGRAADVCEEWPLGS